MRSHEYHFNAVLLLRLLALPIAICFVCSGVLRLGASLRLLPSPRPALDIDRTILIHQAEASRQPSGAEIVLIGDSSCLMDVDARELGRLVGKRVLNLATLSHLGMADHARLLANYLTANSNTVTTVLLLMHPESLRLAGRNSYYSETLDFYFARRDHCGAADYRFLCAAGVHIFRGRLLSRSLPLPLPGAYGQAYGFSDELGAYLTEHHGSAFDPRAFDPQSWSGSAEYRIALSVQSQAEQFAAALPGKIHLIVGITPSPASIVLPNHSALCVSMLDTWAQWLSADNQLRDLPFSLADDQFASSAHLNRTGLALYTQLLAERLKAMP